MQASANQIQPRLLWRFRRVVITMVLVVYLAAFGFLGAWLMTGRFVWLEFSIGTLLGWWVLYRIVLYAILLIAVPMAWKNPKIRDELKASFMPVMAVRAPSNETGENAEEQRIRKRLARLSSEHIDLPPSLSDAVQGWLSLAPGPEKEKERNDLLVRLYDLAAFSDEPFERRRAYNELRLAINPWDDA